MSKLIWGVELGAGQVAFRDGVILRDYPSRLVNDPYSCTDHDILGATMPRALFLFI